jgi:hypothetical protein
MRGLARVMKGITTGLMGTYDLRSAVGVLTLDCGGW